MAMNMSTWMISGPPTGDNLPPFSWNSTLGTVSHVGLPTVYDYEWVLTKPRLHVATRSPAQTDDIKFDLI